MEGEQRVGPLDLVLVEGAQHAPGRAVAIGVPHDQLRDHRVVYRRHLGARLDARVDPHPRPPGLPVGRDRAGGRREVLVGGFGVDSALDRVAAERDVVLAHRQLLARGDPHLLADDVDSGDHLGHAVLDLDPGVHLEEEVLLADLEPLDGSGGAVADRRGGVDRDLADPLAHRGVDVRAGRLLDQLLVAALDRAVALAEVDHVAVRVGEHLDLDVAGILEVALDVHGRVREEPLALAGSALERVLDLLLGSGDPEALAPAPARGLERDRIPDLGRLLRRLLRVLRRLRSCRGRSGPRPRTSARARGSSSPSPRSRRRAGR